MQHPFFPNASFGWTFYLVLVAFTTAAAWVDMRRYVVPKWVTMPMLGLGVLFNVARMAWLGATSEPARVMLVHVEGPWTGALAGLAFAAVGCLFGFGLFFVMWILGTCGGGDVKLFAALGAWGGVELTFLLLLSTMAFVVVLVLAWVAGVPLGRRVGKGQRKGPIPAYAPAVALSVAVLLLWLFRAEMLPAALPAEIGSIAVQQGR